VEVGVGNDVVVLDHGEKEGEEVFCGEERARG
jgi:hypothetical protein